MGKFTTSKRLVAFALSAMFLLFAACIPTFANSILPNEDRNSTVFGTENSISADSMPYTSGNDDMEGTSREEDAGMFGDTSRETIENGIEDTDGEGIVNGTNTGLVGAVGDAATTDDGINVAGIVIAVIIALAIIILIVALIPKSEKRE